MICRNCSAEIEDGLSVCPRCKKDPSKRDYDKKSNKKGPVIIILIAACLLALCIFAGNKIKETELFVTSDITTNESQESTDLTFELTSDPSQYSEVSTDNAAPVTESSVASIETTAYAYDFSLSEPDIIVRKIKDENKTTVAKYGYIEAPKEKFKELSQSKFSSFCEHTVDNSKLKWLTVKFEDSTGLVFNGDNEKFATYCKLNKNCYIESTLGYVILEKSGEYVYISCAAKQQITKAETSEISSQDQETSDENIAFETTNETVAANETDSDVVYVTKSGTKYHRAYCSYLSSSKIEITLSQAKSKGYTACSRCFG